MKSTDPATMGLAGARQIIRLQRVREILRGGQIIKTQTEIAYGVTSLSSEEATPPRLLQLFREHWTIENGQHHRRDRTQDEDRCQVGDPNSARNLSLFRSLAIFLFEQQRGRSNGKKSLPDYERHVFRHGDRLIRRFLAATQE